MALDYTTVYPGQLDPGDPTGYPYGEARNITVPGDGTGFPLERQWVNDLLGFEQSLLDAAGITPSGTPDKVGASQYLTAIETIIEDHVFTFLDAVGANFTGAVTIGENTGDLLVVNSIASFAGPIASTGGALFVSIQVQGTSLFDGHVTLGNSLADLITVKGTTTFDGPVTCNDPLAAGAGLTVAAGASIDGGLTSIGTFIAISTASFQGPVTLGNSTSDPITLGGILTPNGSGGRVRFRETTLPDSDQSFDVGIAGNYYFGSSILNARTYTFDKTTHAEGDWFVIAWRTSASNATISDGSGTIVTLRDSASGDIVAIMCIHDGTDWRIVMRELRP